MGSATTESLAAVAEELLGQIDTLAELVSGGIATELPELAVDARLRELLDSTVLHNVVSALRIVSGADEGLHTHAPAVAVEFARRLAQQGVPLTFMLRAYRLGQAAFQQTVTDRLRDSDLSAVEVIEASLALSSIAFRFIDAVSEQVVAVYQRERDEWRSQRNASQLARLRAVLAGDVTDPHDVEEALGFGLGSPAIAAILWLDHWHDGADATSLEQQVRALAEALGATRAPLSVAADGATMWAWVPRSERDAPVATYEPDAGIHVVLGRPGSGVDGFCRSHRQARQVQALALRAPAGRVPALLTAADAGPLALVGATLDDLRAWVAATLGRLGARDEAAARLRETAWSYLASGSSLNAAAEALHLHKNTIQYRLRRAEELRGCGIGGDRLDLEVALLACRLLGDAVLTDWSPDQATG